MEEQKDYGNRIDGTKKGTGYFGELKMPNGGVMTEFSIGVELDGKEMEIPTVVPTLTKQELNHLLNGGEPNDEIVNKAVKFAISRLKSGQPIFANPDERHPLPADPEESMQKGFESVRGKSKLGL